MLPLLRLILRDITTLARTLREQNRRLARLQQDEKPDADIDALVAEIEATQDQIGSHKDELDQLQVELKDPLTGLLDFPAWIDGREVYLCWRLDEPEVAHWHELSAGFAGRQKLSRHASR
jgi:hypothetical protein